MINPDVVGIPIPDYATRVPQTGGGQSNSATQANAFTEVMTTAQDFHEDCVGSMNEVCLEDFFAAWGSGESEFDIDNSGSVDAQDLAMFLGMIGPSGPPAPGSVEDIQSQWGTVGQSTGDLNGDYIVDGMDLALSLGGSPSTNNDTMTPDPDNGPLQSLLENWGTDASSTDLDSDGITSGSDLTMLLAGLSGLSQSGAQSGTQPAEVSPISQQVFDILNEMGFQDQPPVNINDVIDGLRMGSFESKAVTMDLLELYGKDSSSDGKASRVSRR
tara:strand:- start:669 stop:1484 length:816 start_codon:yes stop_codon:yes gene_type:complete